MYMLFYSLFSYQRRNNDTKHNTKIITAIDRQQTNNSTALSLKRQPNTTQKQTNKQTKAKRANKQNKTEQTNKQTNKDETNKQAKQHKQTHTKKINTHNQTKQNNKTNK